ncbi:hypothetical protein IMY05_016G0032800 [Salix suchowensis]|nr:hypothetical protein IMY05_016G0032800 [Salix suchowensis]
MAVKSTDMHSRRTSKVHDYGSVHGDIKPYKILMATAGLLAATKHLGSSTYVSPEIVKNSMSAAKPPWILKTERKKGPDPVTRDMLSMIGSTHGSNFLRYCCVKSPAWRSTAGEVSSRITSL